MSRREFTKAVKVEIVRRASNILPSGFKYAACEKCKMDARGRFVIDHIDPDALQTDKSRPLTAEEGQLLCLSCNKEKTAQDVKDIAKAKRREARHLGVRKPSTFRKIPKETTSLRVATGIPRLAREWRVKHD